MGRPRNTEDREPHRCCLCFPAVILHGQKAYREHNREKHNASPGWMNFGRVTRRGKLNKPLEKPRMEP